MANKQHPRNNSQNGRSETHGAAGAGSPAARVQAALRALPRVDDVLTMPGLADAVETSRALVRDAVRRVIDDERSRILAGQKPMEAQGLLKRCEEAAHKATLESLRCAVNATGVVVHTNLGRAPLSTRIAEHVADVAAHYSTLEFSVETGERGSRHDHVSRLFCELTGAEDAAIVNNNAAAVLMVLGEFARGREVVVSRGELIEIGGSFRIPDIMELSGAKMVEVGTTNKTHLWDFERAITPETALVLKVHPSNYRVVGFHEEVAAADLAALAHERGVMCYEDQGSGSLLDLQTFGFGPGEHTAGWSLAQGVDLVSCSGDKLLGAGQAGIVLGSAELVGRVKKNPLMRAMRPDKMTLAALEATLRSYLDGTATRDVPVLRMLSMTPGELEAEARLLLADVAARLAVQGIEWTVPAGREGSAFEGEGFCAAVVPTANCTGGGAMPTSEIPGYGVALRVEGFSAAALRARLVANDPRPIVARVADDALVCDVRTLLDQRDKDDLADALARAVVAGRRG